MIVKLLKHPPCVSRPVVNSLPKVSRMDEVERLVPYPWFLDVVDFKGAV